MNYYSYASGVQFLKIGDFESNAVHTTYFSENSTLPKYVDLFLSGKTTEAIAGLANSNALADKEVYALAYMYIQNKQASIALPLFQKLVEKNYAVELVLYNLGDMLWNENKKSQAEKYFTAVLAKNKNHYEAMANLASIQFENGNREESKKLFERVLTINPTHYVACFYLYKIKPNNAYKKCIQEFEPSLVSDL